MLERLVAFGIVVAALFGLATYLRDEGESSPEACHQGTVCGEGAAAESVAPACPDGCAPSRPGPAPAPPLRLLTGKHERHGDGDDENEQDDEDEREEKGDREKRRGKRGRD